MVRSMGRLLRRQGYAATGLQQLVLEAEAPMGSMYFHFPNGKEQLAAEAVARSGSDLGEMLATPLGGADTPAAVRAITAAMGADLKRSRWHNGCPIATTALEMAADSEAIRSATNAVFDQWELLFVQRMRADGIPLPRAPERLPDDPSQLPQREPAPNGSAASCAAWRAAGAGRPARSRDRRTAWA